MTKIKVKNFGPIREGYQQNEGWMDIRKVSVFIGNQGSGKSTIAKLVSTLSWIEKAIVKGQIREDELSSYNRFRKRLSYQRIDNYLKPETEIEFRGDRYYFKFVDDDFMVVKNQEGDYHLPKIMYVPAERNFLSVVDRPDKLKELPLPLFTFLDEYDRARNVFWEGLVLPINNAKFQYDRQHKIARIVDDGYELRLSEASSGFQSTVPLFLVTKYLAEWLNLEGDSSIKENSIEEQRRLEREVKRISEDDKLSPEVKEEYLRQLSARRRPSCFVNVVEEPEQNLFPSSQRSMLYELLNYVNHGEHNKLIMTTHSPYLINYLSLAIKGNQVLDKIRSSHNGDMLMIKLDHIVPIKSTLKSDDLVIYEMNESTGTIVKLEDYKGLPSDENYLNLKMAETNEMFADLLNIEDQCQ